MHATHTVTDPTILAIEADHLAGRCPCPDCRHDAEVVAAFDAFDAFDAPDMDGLWAEQLAADFEADRWCDYVEECERLEAIERVNEATAEARDRALPPDHWA